MITKREINYVNSSSHTIPYPGKDYAEEALKKLVTAGEDFNKFYSDKEYDIVLSNGEQLIFEILNKNLCHMLGINYRSIMDNSFYDEFRYDVLGLGDGHIKSYDFLLSIIANSDKVLQYEEETRKRILNYYRIMIKCSIFEKLSDFTEFNFGVINFDKDEYLKNAGYNFLGRSNKLFYVQTNETVAPYFMMGLLPDSDSNDGKYAVETLIAPIETKDFFNNQEVVIPTQILVTTNDSMDKYQATPQEKIALLNQYKSIINEYELPSRLNIYGDYESILVEQSQTRVRK